MINPPQTRSLGIRALEIQSPTRVPAQNRSGSAAPGLTHRRFDLAEVSESVSDDSQKSDWFPGDFDAAERADDALARRLESAFARTAVVLPAYNEENSLPLVLTDLPAVGLRVVVNNGSTDATAPVAHAFGCEVVDEPRRGYGRACLAGIDRVESMGRLDGSEIEYIAFLDADYSDFPDELYRLMLPILRGEADFVLGSRLRGKRQSGSMPPQAVWGNRLACFLMRLIWKADYTDLGPFRLIRRDVLKQLDMQDTNFGWTVEMQVKATVAGVRTMEVPVTYRRRVGVSKISGTVSGTVRAGYKILYTIARLAWQTKRAGAAASKAE